MVAYVLVAVTDIVFSITMIFSNSAVVVSRCGKETDRKSGLVCDAHA